MPRLYRLQSNFTKGVLDPRLAARTDVDAYYNGVAEGTNVIPLVQGGLARRPGLEFVDDLGTGEARIIPFSFNTEQEYLFVMTDLQIEVFKDGVSQATIVTPWDDTEMFDVRYTQSADTMILVHEDHAPRKIVRGATHTSWTLSTITFTNIPQWYYNDASSPASTDEIQRIDFGAIANGNDFQIILEGQNTKVLTFNGNDTTENARQIEAALNNLSNTPNAGITVAYVSGVLYDVTFGGAAADSWPLMMVQEVNTGSDVGTVTRSQTGVAGTEDIMSAGRGWPRTVTFHEGRLWFGGFQSLPQTLMASRVADFFNLDVGTGLDDEAILVTIDTDQVNAVEALYSSRQLQIFTSGGEFIVPTSESRPITPSTIAIRRQTRHGSSSVPPVSIDGSTLFLERNGRVLRDFVFDIAEESYTAPPASVMSSELIQTPVDMKALRGTANEQSNYIYIVNSDGTVAVFNLLRSQNIASFVKWTTLGDFESVTVVDDTVYFVVKRTINATDKRYLECLNYDMYVDSGLDVAPGGTTVTGFTHLEAETVRVRGDDAVLADETVASGQFVLDETYTTVQAGLNFDPLIKTMPLNVDFGNGATFSRKKRYIEASFHLFESLGIIVDDRRIPDRNFGDITDDTPEPFSGLKQAYVHGWTDIAQLEIKQDDPLPMTLTGLVLEVEVT